MGKKIVHVEFPAADLERGKAFWEGVGGWSLNDAGMPGMQYLMFQEGDQGGAVFSMEGAKGTTIYLGSDDIDADLAKVRELARASEDASWDDEIRVVVLTGAGRAFCVGADLKSWSEDYLGNPREYWKWFGAFKDAHEGRIIHETTVPGSTASLGCSRTSPLPCEWAPTRATPSASRRQTVCRPGSSSGS